MSRLLRLNSETLELEDCPSNLLKQKTVNKVLIALLTAVSVIMMFIVMARTPQIKTVETILIDTFDANTLDTSFLSEKPTVKNVLTYLMLMGATHPYESCAQMCEESTYMRSNIAKKYNNLGGFLDGKKKPIYFTHWTEFVRIYLIWQRKHKLVSGVNFYQWINVVPYNPDDAGYDMRIRSIEIKLRQNYPLRDILLDQRFR